MRRRRLVVGDRVGGRGGRGRSGAARIRRRGRRCRDRRRRRRRLLPRLDAHRFTRHLTPVGARSRARRVGARSKPWSHGAVGARVGARRIGARFRSRGLGARCVGARRFATNRVARRLRSRIGLRCFRAIGARIGPRRRRCGLRRRRGLRRIGDARHCSLRGGRFGRDLGRRISVPLREPGFVGLLFVRPLPLEQPRKDAHRRATVARAYQPPPRIDRAVSER